jgi:glucose-6-phosphate 1-dehydrogenase
MHRDDSAPLSIVIFGASGDLTHRKLVPALYNLYRKDRLSKNTLIIGVARRPWDDEQFRRGLCQAAEESSPETYEAEVWQRFEPMLTYFRGNLKHPEDFKELAAHLDSIEKQPTDRLYYLAIGPNLYEQTVQCLGEAGMAEEKDAERSLVIEKPFGRDLESAHRLNGIVHNVFKEEQVFRIDHYLGKETAQNILFFRFANTIFEPVWNRRYVDYIQITVAETVDVDHRAGFYDSTGILRDMFQNHLLQLSTLIAMEPPASFEADALRNEKVKVLSAIRPIAIEDTVLGQYHGYQHTEGVEQDSRTATFAALKFYIDNWRWQGVPFYLRSGKALKEKTSEITVVFQSPPHILFNQSTHTEMTPNILSMCIQPNEGIHLKFETKLPDSGQDTRSVDMEFHYRESFGDGPLPDAYERLLLDALHRDASLFARSDEIEYAWRLIDPVVTAWERREDLRPFAYEKNTWGPAEAQALMTRSNRRWRIGCGKHDVMVQ